MDEPLTRARETPRQRALRIPLAYHRTRGTMWTWKVLFSLAGFIIGGLYIGWVLAGGKPAATQASPGTLASDHARWDSDCRACHVPFVPQRPDADGTRMFSLSLAGNNIHQQTDAKCSECHKSAGPHHATQISADVESCASCHRDHQGRDFDMARMDDVHCTNCHASITGHRNSPSKSPIANVTAFEVPSPDGGTGHPPFRSLQIEEDPGNIRFSHRLHMTPGQLYPGQTPPPGKELVQLTCDACHQDSPAPLGGGAYMQPINFARHCQSCHPLHIPGKAAAIPHGLKAEQLETVVAGLLAGEESRPAATPQRLIPGKTRPEKGKQEDLHPPRALVAASHLQQLRANSCSKCHSWQPEKPEVVPASIPVVWLKGARFNHASHQAAAKCQDCHPQASESASGGQPGSLADDERVMIPDIDNCARCHAPTNDSAGHGARYDCAECHRYHANPEKPPPAAFAVLQTMEKLTSPPTRKNAAHDFVGTQSCSAAGCHGASQGTDFTSSFSRFTAADPHTGAFLLLYTSSSLEIYRRFTSQPQAMLEGAAYFRFAQEKCIGCHATPLADPTAANLIENQAGVTCESCHGAAKKREFTHFFDRGNKAVDRPSDLANLSVSAATCAQCHIGPQHIAGRSYDVNHELIAAGHPRLTFEFEAQLANLPPHWSPAKNAKSYFDAWRLGELATAAQQDKLYADRAPHEFASHRCFDCHHGLTSQPAAARVDFPPLAVISKEQRELLAGPAPSKQEQAGLLLKLLSGVTDEQAKSSPGAHWEEHVRFSLALSAYAADNPQGGELANHANELSAILTHSFRTLPRDRKTKAEAFFAGGPYDSPTGFDPHDERLQKVLENIRASLNSP